MFSKLVQPLLPFSHYGHIGDALVLLRESLTQIPFHLHILYGLVHPGTEQPQAIGNVTDLHRNPSLFQLVDYIQKLNIKSSFCAVITHVLKEFP